MAARKCTPPQTRLRPQSRAKSLHVDQPIVMSRAGVIPGSMREEPFGVGIVQSSASEPRKRRLASACAAQKLADPDGYSGWSATYLMPRRVGAETTARLTSAPFEPVGARRAAELGLLDGVFGETAEEFRAGVRRYAERLAWTAPAALGERRRARAHDERHKPLEAYRSEELRRSYECFFGPDRSSHEARRRFVFKLPSERSE